jgi:hypothetical protein
MLYQIKIVPHGRSAKTKGLITGGWTETSKSHDIVYYRMGCMGMSVRPEYLTLSADDDAQAVKIAAEMFEPQDSRPLAGKSYLRDARRPSPYRATKLPLKRPGGS